MAKSNKKEMILQGNLYKIILSLSTPIVINSLIQTLYNLVDGIYVGKISSTHFAATSFVWPINFLFISIGIGFSVAGTSILSQLIGSGHEKKAEKYAEQLIFITLISSLIFTAIGYFLTPYAVRLMGAKGDFAQYGIDYLRITFLDLSFMFLYFNINSIMNAQGNTLIPTILSGLSALINIILDPIFIFDFGWGIGGAAWATVVSRAVLAVAGILILFTPVNKIKISFRNFKVNKKILREIIQVGTPAALGQSGAAMGFIVLNGFIGSYGTSTIAAFGMVNRITSLVMQPAMGIGAGLTAIVGQNIGANQLDRVEEAFRKSLLITIIIGSLGAILMLYYDKEIIDFFIKSKEDPSVISQSIEYLWYISLSMPLMGIFSVLQGLFQGSGHTRYSMAMEIGRLWLVRLPMILVFKNFTKLGPVGIWFSMSFSNLIVCLYGYMVYRKNLWKERIIREEVIL